MVQANQLKTGLPQTIVSMITSNMDRSGHPSRLFVSAASEEAQRTGLLMDSVIMTDNLATVHESEVDRIIGDFPRMNDVDAALRATLAL